MIHLSHKSVSIVLKTCQSVLPAEGLGGKVVGGFALNLINLFYFLLKYICLSILFVGIMLYNTKQKE